MGSKEVSLEVFQSMVCSLRYTDYYCTITEIQDELWLPAKISLDEMEAILIQATKDCFNDTLSGDITLMALGLMKEFYHHEICGKEKKEMPIKKRRIKFLDESCYLEEEYNNLYTSYEDIEKSGARAIKRVFDKLEKTEDRLINKVAEKIYKKSEKQLEKYVGISSNEYIIKKSSYSSTVDVLKLPDMIHVKQCRPNLRSVTKTIDIAATDDTRSDDTSNHLIDTRFESSAKKHDGITVQVNITNTGFISGAERINQYLPPVEKIFVSEEKIEIEPCRMYKIKTAILPAEAQKAFLNYISTNTSIATVSAEGIVTTKDKCGSTDVIIQAESGSTAKITIVVKDNEKKISDFHSKANPSIKYDIKGYSNENIDTSEDSILEVNNDSIRKVKHAFWGPDRPTYTNEKPADHAVFNSITNNAAVGDERDFVRIEEKSSGRPYSSEIGIEAGKQYEVYIYYHNDASETYNDKAHNYVGIARDVRLASSFPHELKAGERAAVTGKITSTNANPAAVWDEAYVTAKEDMTLHYVTGSAKIYNSHETNGSILSTKLFSSTGTFLGFKELNGVIFGGIKFSGQIVYTIQTKAADVN